MISLQEVYKVFPTKGGRKKTVLKGVSHDFVPGINTGILGRNGAGKSTLLQIVGGSIAPDRGRVVREGKISWPIGFSGGFNSKISGRENLRFICRLYAEDYRRVADFVEDFSELGDYLDMPIYTYSSGMKAKLAFGVSMAFNFEFFLIDEVTAVGDAVFKKKSQAFFLERRKTATLIVVSHNMATINSLCDKMLVLHEGTLHDFGSNKEAQDYYTNVCCKRT